MRVNIKRKDVKYHCTSQEQLDKFLKAGWEIDEPKAETPEEEKPKTITPRKTTKKK